MPDSTGTWKRFFSYKKYITRMMNCKPGDFLQIFIQNCAQSLLLLHEFGDFFFYVYNEPVSLMSIME